MLVASAGGAWWTARIPEGRDELDAILKRLDGRFIFESSPDRVTPYEAMRIIEYDDADVGYLVTRRFDAYATVGRDRYYEQLYADTLNTTSVVGLIDPYVRSRAADVQRQSINRRRITMRTMTRALEALRGAGPQGHDPGLPGLRLPAGLQGDAGARRGLDARERADPLHRHPRPGRPARGHDRGLHRSGHVQDTVAVLADITREAEGSENVALDTGGIVVKNTNDLSSGIARVSAESQAFYLLGYQPSDRTRDGKFRRIKVKLDDDKDDGLKVRARRGYYAPLEGEKPDFESKADPAIVHALDSPYEIRAVPLRVSTFAFDVTFANQLNVMVAVEIDVRNLELVEEEGRIKGDLAFLVEAQHLESGEYYNIDEKIEMAMLPETYERLKQTGYVVSREFTLPSGDYQAKVVVRDLASGKVGSVIHDFAVPDGRGSASRLP